MIGRVGRTGLPATVSAVPKVSWRIRGVGPMFIAAPSSGVAGCLAAYGPSRRSRPLDPSQPGPSVEVRWYAPEGSQARAAPARRPHQAGAPTPRVARAHAPEAAAA